MPKKAVVLAVSLCIVASFLTFRLGSSPTVKAQSPSLPVAPETWALTSPPYGSGQPVRVVRPAGGTGVKHVATCVQGFMHSLGTSGWWALELYDGQTLLQQWYVILPDGHNGTWSQCDLNIAGSANTSMTLQWATTGNGFAGKVNLVGYDAQ